MKNKAELEQAYSELDRISHSMEYVREKFSDYYTENLSSCKPSIKIHFPDDENHMKSIAYQMLRKSVELARN